MDFDDVVERRYVDVEESRAEEDGNTAVVREADGKVTVVLGASGNSEGNGGVLSSGERILNRSLYEYVAEDFGGKILIW